MISDSHSFAGVKEYKVIGIMSGTSLDGLDLAYCIFKEDGRGYTFSIEEAATIPYPAEWQERLATLVNASGLELTIAHTELGKFIGREVKKFTEQKQLKPDLIGSHGHTIFHQPQKGFSLQIGDGYYIMVESGCTVINDFRSLDIALGGQGAPLVPIGDELLFGQYDFCLNLGGIANISAARNGRRIAYDVCPANMVLNKLALQEGKPYDAGGAMAASGKLYQELLDMLNQLDFYSLKPPKSLGYEWVSEQVFPLLEGQEISTADQLHTFCHHMARQISLSLSPLALEKEQSLLVSGGGAYNSFFISLLEQELKNFNIKVVIPDSQIIEYKEALIFGLLAVLRLRKEVNCLASVTGAVRDSCGGLIYSL